MNVIPAQEPSAGPNYFNFDDNVLYQIHLDTDQDGVANDVVYQFRFETEIRAPFNVLPLAYAGVSGVPGLPLPITALDGPGSDGLGVRQRYSVTEVRGKMRTDLGTGSMFAVPSNVGPRTMPNYEALAAKGIYALKNGGSAFAGQRDDSFYIDLGATFDSLNFRAPPILNGSQDLSNNTNPFGIDMFSGFNVNTIAIEVPITSLTNDPNAIIGVYASTSRGNTTLRKGAPGKVGPGSFLITEKGKDVQVSKMANPLVNELVIGTGKKDLWNATKPEDVANFMSFYANPTLAAVLNLAFGTNFPVTGRDDLVNVLLKYPGQPQNGQCTKSNVCSELLRLNLGVPPTQPASQKRLGVLAGDLAGFPNGRRTNDDVTDITLRVVAGALLGPVPNLGDGVNFNVGAPGAGTSDGLGYGIVPGNRLDVTMNGIAMEFPFLPTPHDGRNRRHLDCVQNTGAPCIEP
jgi:hypothetical protein